MEKVRDDVLSLVRAADSAGSTTTAQQDETDEVTA
jgi:hypothetical protein